MIRSSAIYNFRRDELERWIDQAIALLDEIDDDPDLEECGDDEPSFGCARYLKGKFECELEEDAAELGIADQDALCLELQNLDEGLQFDGDGRHIARKLLKDKVKDRAKLTEALNRTRVSPPMQVSVPDLAEPRKPHPRGSNDLEHHPDARC